MFWEVDLRPQGKRKYFSPKDTALGEAQIQRTRLRKEHAKRSRNLKPAVASNPSCRQILGPFSIKAL
jgi:hypothetical protein